MKPLQIAVEYERGLHHAHDFRVANLASEFLSHRLNLDERGNTKYFHREGTRHQTEYNSLRPLSNLNLLCMEFLKAEELSDRISAELGVLNIPISETSAGVAEINPEVMNRVYGYQTIFGNEAVKKLIRISGIHLHVDQFPGRLADQFNALTALRPTIALTSTSSISYLGENKVNCHRYKIIADPKEGVFAKIPEERGYINSMEELERRDQERHNKWSTEFANSYNRRHSKGLPLTYNLDSFLEHFPVEKTGYPDVRNRPNMGKGTFELRINDTAPLNIVLGQAALVLGYNRRILLDTIPVNIAENNFKNDGKYQFHQNGVLLPNQDTLDYYTLQARDHGLENPQVREYLSALCEFAQEGLSAHEQHYLKPYVEMLASGQNLASELLRMLGHKIHYSPQDGALANQFIWNKHQHSIQSLQDKIAYQRGVYVCVE
ncbi:MAG TPA: hypothetical protein VJB13_01645 [Candidatus Nanoarchaeia archaeon]|nr:hypothetical protein [Candidatus Nanoarchaeia archaeon]